MDNFNNMENSTDLTNPNNLGSLVNLANPNNIIDGALSSSFAQRQKMNNQNLTRDRNDYNSSREQIGKIQCKKSSRVEVFVIFLAIGINILWILHKLFVHFF